MELPFKAVHDLVLGNYVHYFIDHVGNLNTFTSDSFESLKIMGGKNLRTVKLTDNSLFTLSSNGTLYAILNGKTVRLDLPSSRNWFEKIESFDTGANHLLALTNHGRVYGFSSAPNSNNQGQLGDITSQNVLTPLLGLEEVKAVSCGDEHSLILFNNGKVKSLGSNSHGQLAHSDQTIGASFPTLQSVKLPFVNRIGAGGNTSFFSTVEGTYSAGDGLFGQLATRNFYHARGIPMKSKDLSLTQFINNIETPIEVSFDVSQTHTAATLHTGNGQFANEVMFAGKKVLTNGNTAKAEVIELDNERLQLHKSVVKIKGKSFNTAQAVAVNDTLTAIYNKII